MIEIGIVPLTLAILAVVGAIAGAWWRIENRVEKAKNEAIVSASAAHTLATLAGTQLQEHKLHVAETYVTKVGLREQTEQIMSALSGMKISLESMNLRLDRVIERQASGA